MSASASSSTQPVGPAAGDPAAAAERALAANPVWYHTLQLPGGLVTPGQIDLRRVAEKLLPRELDGLRALDVGTFDGFWAFELERRGAQVVAIDIDEVSQAQIPPNNRALVEREAEAFDVRLGRGFALAAELLGSRVQRVPLSVMELTPDAIGGPVDMAFMGALLIHLRDPVGALERVAQALSPGGRLLQLETVSLPLTLRHPRRPVAQLHTFASGFNWWLPNARALKGYLATAGFTSIRAHGLHHPPQQRPMHDWYLGLSSQRPA